MSGLVQPKALTVCRVHTSRIKGIHVRAFAALASCDDHAPDSPLSSSVLVNSFARSLAFSVTHSQVNSAVGPYPKHVKDPAVHLWYMINMTYVATSQRILLIIIIILPLASFPRSSGACA